MLSGGRERVQWEQMGKWEDRYDKKRQSEAQPGPPQTSKMASFATIVNGWKPLTIAANLYILDVCLGFGYTPDSYYQYVWIQVTSEAKPSDRKI